MATARAGLPPINLFFGSAQRHTGDLIVAANCLEPALTLDAYTTKYDAMALPTLRPGTTAKQAGVRINGITDGFSGSAPDLGALITGRAPITYGDPRT